MAEPGVLWAVARIWAPARPPGDRHSKGLTAADSPAARLAPGALCPTAGPLSGGPGGPRSEFFPRPVPVSLGAASCFPWGLSTQLLVPDQRLLGRGLGLVGVAGRQTWPVAGRVISHDGVLSLYFAFIVSCLTPPTTLAGVGGVRGGYIILISVLQRKRSQRG